MRVIDERFATKPPVWALFAVCRGEPTQLFFGSWDELDDRRSEREANAVTVCHGCPCRLACRDHAREFGERGVWGGETDYDRRRPL
jgi:WhiB family transcriptional regulator, redox-sensing transcriptional regulator